MKIYQLLNRADGFATIDFGALNISEIFKLGNIKELEGKTFKWRKDKDNFEISDCPFYIGAFPIFKSDRIESILTDLNVEYAKFLVEGVSYTALSAPLFSGDVINKDHSSLKTFKSGKIMTIKKYVFNAGFDYPSIFRLQEFNLFTFVNQEVKHKLESCEFQDIIFEECEIISNKATYN